MNTEHICSRIQLAVAEQLQKFSGKKLTSVCMNEIQFQVRSVVDQELRKMQGTIRSEPSVIRHPRQPV